MLFTVFQYIPILEEETHAHKVELAKKAKTNDLGSGDGSDADTDADTDSDDDDSEQEFNYLASSFSASFYMHHTIHFSSGNDLYKYLIESKDTPPPKI